MSKTERFTIKPREIRGHQEHDQGCGRHDNRPKRLRTRQAVKRAAIKEWA